MQGVAPRWLGDDETAVCLGCHAPFDGWNWRHHCRRCGGIFCDACSPYKCLIHPADVVYPPDWDSLLSTFDPREPLRTCAACREALLPYQDDLRKTCSNASQTTEVDRADVARYLNVPLQFDMRSEIQKATHTLLNFCADNALEGASDQVPADLIASAWGLAFLTTMQAGFFFSARVGSGLVIARTRDGGWSAPSAVCTAGAGWGLQIGGEVTDMLVVLNSQDAVDAFASTAQMSLGTEIGMAVGPFGRSAETAVTAGDGGASAVFSYAHSKGLFAGVALHACVVLARPDCNESFYGADHAVDAILSGGVERPRAAQPLYDALDEVLAGERPFGEHGEGRGEWLAEAAATRDEYGDASDDPFAPRVDCPSQVAADEALARRLAAEDERPADAWANAPAPPKDDGWARERERRRRRAGDDGPSEELREFSGERKGDDLDEIDI